ncbi:MAG: chemotaxis protein CheA [Deltaproteobacteria bacterium]|nr:chemotaxis protein CheA [Deltaproteobacteria bacterium]
MSAQDDELWLLFVEDGTRAIDESDQGLLDLEQRPEAKESIDAVYRAMHSFKGNARALGLRNLERFAHKAEDLAAIIRERGRLDQPILLEALLEATEQLRGFLGHISLHRSDIEAGPAKVAEQKLTKALEAAEATKSDTIEVDGFMLFDEEPAAVEEPRPAPPPVLAAEAPAQVAAPAPAPAAAASTPAKAEPGNHEQDSFVRVRSSKIQQLLGLASEISLTADATLRDPALLELDSEELTRNADRLQRLLRDLKYSAAGLGLSPVGELFARMRKVARDLGKETGKQIQLQVSGEDTEVDRTLTDRLADPLMHMIRNSGDHGLETTEERIAAGKPPIGKITLSASQVGDEVVIRVSDDGRGVNRAAVRKKAIDRGLITADQVLDDASVDRLILLPGFSTAQQVTNLSGRGVGMDVVAKAVEGLRGRLEIRSVPGKGTSFSMVLPLTLAFLEAMVATVGEHCFAFPLGAVSKILRPTASDEIKNAADDRPLVRVLGEPIPVCELRSYYGSPRSNRAFTDGVMIVVKTSRGPLAIPVDQVLGTEQVTLRPLEGLISGIRAASACGILKNGGVAITLDCERLSHARA